LGHAAEGSEGLLSQWLSIPVAVLLVVTLGSSAAVWGWIVARWRRGQPIVAFQGRTPVPWRAPDVAAVALSYGLFSVLVPHVDQQLGLVNRFVAWHGEHGGQRGGVEGDDEDEWSQAAHPVVVLLRQRREAGLFVFCLVVAAVVVPVTEEVLFRLVLQGWLESAERRLRRTIPAARRVVPGTWAVVSTSFIFAALHYRGMPPEADPLELLRLLVYVGVVDLCVVAVAVAWLRGPAGATAADLGWSGRQLWADVQLGMAAFLAVVAPVYGIQIALRLCLPHNPIVDPISLFLFALVLGTLYYRTHRIVPSIVTHVAFNGFSLTLLRLGLAPPG